MLKFPGFCSIFTAAILAISHTLEIIKNSQSHNTQRLLKYANWDQKLLPPQQHTKKNPKSNIIVWAKLPGHYGFNIIIKKNIQKKIKYIQGGRCLYFQRCFFNRLTAQYDIIATK